MKLILIAVTIVCAARSVPAHAETCQELRTKLDRVEKVIDKEKEWLDSEGFDSEENDAILPRQSVLPGHTFKQLT